MESVFAWVAGRFARVDLRRRMRDYVRGLLAPVERKNGWQLAEWAGHRDPAGLQHLLHGACWDADAIRDDVRDYVGWRLGPRAVLRAAAAIDDIRFGLQRVRQVECGRVGNQRGSCADGSGLRTPHPAAQEPRALRVPPP
ncbi:transposase [Streptomyces neyagawaensis]|nr:transposase [Streptomyces neyagawaensis]MDE1688676.1 transposase [Streptomyces neyagawaensis]